MKPSSFSLDSCGVMSVAFFSARAAIGYTFIYESVKVHEKGFPIRIIYGGETVDDSIDCGRKQMALAWLRCPVGRKKDVAAVKVQHFLDQSGFANPPASVNYYELRLISLQSSL